MAEQKRSLKTYFIRVLGPLYGRLLYSIAYGPFGPWHRVQIAIFKKLYNIDFDPTKRFKTLGDFFLRDIEITPSEKPLVSPAEARRLEGPLPLFQSEPLEVKGLDYYWEDFHELELQKLPKSARFWNLYLAPSNYHWVHSPSAGKNLKAYRFKGDLWPVNALGRKLSPRLYAVNERITFQYEHETFGKIYVICVGALGVSGLISAKGEVSEGAWTPLSSSLEKAEKLLAFRLGSTVLLVVENPPEALPNAKEVLRVGDALY